MGRLTLPYHKGTNDPPPNIEELREMEGQNEPENISKERERIIAIMQPTPDERA